MIGQRTASLPALQFSPLFLLAFRGREGETEVDLFLAVHYPVEFDVLSPQNVILIHKFVWKKFEKT